MIQTEQFIKYMKMCENAGLYAGDEGKIVHESPEGGLETVGYGHKLNVLEKQTQQIYGWNIAELTREQCDYILALDIESRANSLAQIVPAWDKRSQREKEMLVEFQFNLGNVEKKFPKFYNAVLARDLSTQRAEYKRHYKDPKGNKKELTRRNRLFYARYLSPLAIKGWSE